MIPNFFLSNVRSLCNKVDELQLLMVKNRLSFIFWLGFMDTWLCDLIPDAALQQPGFQLVRADRDTAFSGKMKGGGICFYINSGWCVDMTVIPQHCFPDLCHLCHKL